MQKREFLRLFSLLLLASAPVLAQPLKTKAQKRILVIGAGLAGLADAGLKVVMCTPTATPPKR